MYKSRFLGNFRNLLLFYLYLCQIIFEICLTFDNIICITVLHQLKRLNNIFSTGFFNAVQVYGVPLKNSVEKLIFLIMQIQIFKFKEQEVRTKLINGKEYFCASDVCKILDIQNGRDTIASLENGCVVKTDIPHPQSQNKALQVSFVNEVGLYEIIFKSIKPEARLFRKWIFEEVLPQIRKTGGYNIEAISKTDLALMVIEVEKEKAKMQLQIEEQDKQITYYDNMLVAQGTFCLQDGAKALHLKPNKFIETLRIRDYLTKDNIAKQRYINSGLFATKIITQNNKQKIKQEKLQTMITAKGIVYFAKSVLKDFTDILDKPTSKKIFEKIKAKDKDEVVLSLLNNNL